MAGKSTIQKRLTNPWNNGNPLEAFKDIASDLRRSFTKDLLKGTGDDILSETQALFGLKPRKEASGTLAPGETLDFKAIQIIQEERGQVAEDRKPRLETQFRPSENFLFLQKEKALEQEIEAILTEIKREIKRFDEATQKLEQETAKVVVEEVPPNPGIYHVNFFEWLLGILRDIRQRVEDAGTWISVLQSRKAKRGYWSQFKKHGTSFGLSSERVVATQTG